MLALAERFDEPLVALRAHQRLVFDHFELGDLAGIDAHLRAYDALVERVRLPRALARVGGASCRVKTTKGVELLARLTAEPSREHHVLDLVGADGAVDAGDAGEVLDKSAIAAYRARVLELRRALDEAESWDDGVRAERIRDELEALESEL